MTLVDEDRLTGYYGSAYRHDANIAVLSVSSEALYRQRGAALLALAERFLGRPPARIFEVGAGYGFNLLAFIERHPGVAAFTDEVDAEASPTNEGRIARGALADGGYDVIILSHVVEHFTDPKALLIHAVRALTAGGVVVIDVPNDIDGIVRLNGQDEPHLTFFEIDTLRALLDRAGVETLALYTCGPDNIADTLGQRLKRVVRRAVAAVPFLERLRQRRAAGKFASDERFGTENPNGCYLRAAVRQR